MKKRNMKILTAIAAACVMLAGCAGSKAPENEEQSSVTSAEAAAEASSVSESTDDSNGEEDILPEENIDDLNINSGSEEADVISENPLMPIASAALDANEWPVMAEVTDSFMLTEFFLLDGENENYNDLLVLQCPISAVMSEIIIIDAADADAAKEDLEARRTKAIETDAWYPNDKELAEASIVGTNGNYAYFIIGTYAAEAENAINAYIDGMNQ